MCVALLWGMYNYYNTRIHMHMDAIQHMQPHFKLSHVQTASGCDLGLKLICILCNNPYNALT